MNVLGVDITENRKRWLLAVTLHVELQIGRQLSEPEVDQVLIAAVRHLAEPEALTTRLQ